VFCYETATEDLLGGHLSHFGLSEGERIAFVVTRDELVDVGWSNRTASCHKVICSGYR
jgi:hypothetical protein